MTSEPKSEQNWPDARTGFRSLQGTWQGGILANMAFSQFCSDFGLDVIFVVLLKNSSMNVALPDPADEVYSEPSLGLLQRKIVPGMSSLLRKGPLWHTTYHLDILVLSLS